MFQPTPPGGDTIDTLTAVAAVSPRPVAPTPEDVMAVVGRSLDDDQAQSAVVIPLAGKSSMADFLVIASGRSTRHVGALAENLRERLKASGVRGIEIEGLPHCDWVLVDAGDVIVHLFRPEVRAFYNLEKMWGVESPHAEPESLDEGAAESLDEYPIAANSGLPDGEIEDGELLDGEFEDGDLTDDDDE
jgi:ribosome-associated protein